MTWEQKSHLIQKDPVTCARNFDHMVQLFISDVLKSNVMPIREIADYFYRVEISTKRKPTYSWFILGEGPYQNQRILSILFVYKEYTLFVPHCCGVHI